MTRDRRGFRYVLQPVLSMTSWEVDQIAHELASHNALVREQEAKVGQLAGALGAARDAVMQQRQSAARLDIDAQRNAHAYMLQVQQLLLVERAALRELEQERDAVHARFVEARKLADGLERDKEAAAAEHDMAVAKRDYQQSDDNWLQRQHWRNPQ